MRTFGEFCALAIALTPIAVTVVAYERLRRRAAGGGVPHHAADAPFRAMPLSATSFPKPPPTPRPSRRLATMAESDSGREGRTGRAGSSIG